jgi:hypothetical protein
VSVFSRGKPVVVISRETRETETPFDDDDAALLYAVKESLRLGGLSIELVLGDGHRRWVWTQTL